MCTVATSTWAQKAGRPPSRLAWSAAAARAASRGRWRRACCPRQRPPARHLQPARRRHHAPRPHADGVASTWRGSGGGVGGAGARQGPSGEGGPRAHRARRGRRGRRTRRAGRSRARWARVSRRCPGGSAAGTRPPPARAPRCVAPAQGSDPIPGPTVRDVARLCAHPGAAQPREGGAGGARRAGPQATRGALRGMASARPGATCMAGELLSARTCAIQL
jgi:hypothetical protein